MTAPVLSLGWNPDTLSADLAAGAEAGGDLAGLASAVIVSLFTDRLAEADDTLPAGDGDRRGWWGDALAADGDRIGSRLWLLNREKQRRSVLGRAEDYCREALQWLIDDGIAEAVDIEVAFIRRGVLGIAVTVHRPAADPATFRYDYVWGAG